MLPLLTDSDITGLRDDITMVSVLLVLRLELLEVPGRVQLAKEHTVSLEPFRG